MIDILSSHPIFAEELTRMEIVTWLTLVIAVRANKKNHVLQ